VSIKGNRIKRKLGWVEAAFYAGGVVLLAVFFLIRFDAEQQREESIEEFREKLTTQLQVHDPDTGESMLASVTEPDFETWNRKRIDAYEKSLEAESSPPIGILTIDTLNVQVPVFNGTDEIDLNRGVGRVLGTAAIDDSSGNLAIAGHRDGFFRPLKDISVGDSIELQTTRGTVSYEVSSITIVDASEVSVLWPTPERTLTLVTCYPFYYVGHAPKRYIVKATAEHLLASN
jgi:sortase A